MTYQEYIEQMTDGKYLQAGTEITACMRPFAREAQRITAEINGRYHSAEELNALVSELIGFGVLFSGSGRDRHRRRHAHRASGGVRNA